MQDVRQRLRKAMRDRAIALNSGTSTTKKICCLFFTKRREVLKKLNFHGSEAVGGLVVFGGNTGNLRKVLAQNCGETRIRGHCIATSQRKLEQITRGEASRTITDQNLSSTSITSDVLTHSCAFQVQRP